MNLRQSHTTANSFSSLLIEQNLIQYDDEEFFYTVKSNLIHFYRRLIKLPFYFLFFKIILGLILFTFPVLYCLLKISSIFDIDEGSGIKISSSVVWIILSLIIILTYIATLLFWSIFNYLINPNLKYWNLSTIGRTFQYLIFFVCLFSFLISLFVVLREIDYNVNIIIKKYKEGFLLYNLPAWINIVMDSNITKAVEGISTSSLTFFSILYLIRLILFQTRHTLNLLGINVFFLILLFNNSYKDDIVAYIDQSIFYISLIFICYSLILLQNSYKIYRKNSESELTHLRPKYYWRRVCLMFNLLSLIGCVIIISGCVNYLSNYKSITSRLTSLAKCLNTGVLFLIFGSALALGELLVDFLFYPIRKEYSAYSNYLYKEHILKIKYSF